MNEVPNPYESPQARAARPATTTPRAKVDWVLPLIALGAGPGIAMIVFWLIPYGERERENPHFRDDHAREGIALFQIGLIAGIIGMLGVWIYEVVRTVRSSRTPEQATDRADE